MDHCVEREWPDEDEGPNAHSGYHPDHGASRAGTPLGSASLPTVRDTTYFRLTVLSSSVLSCRGVALIDSYDEISIGRDRCATPRLRLKELAVSKYHASIYWDSSARNWSLVDMGSVHGTYLVSPDWPETSNPASGYGCSPGKPIRLSPPKTASLPMPLSHLQHIVIGNTTLVVHIHPDRQPCDACTIIEDNLISLETLDTSRKVAKSASRREPEPYTVNPLKALRQNLLSHPAYSVSAYDQANLPPGTYVDRAELRRQRFPGWRDVSAEREVTPSRRTPNRHYHPRVLCDPRLASDEPGRRLETAAPIPLSNVGHRLLAKQGWVPGSSLGAHSRDETPHSALTEPLVLQGTSDRRGLGMNRI